MSSQIFIAYNSSWYEFFDTNYLKCSNSFATVCSKIILFLIMLAKIQSNKILTSLMKIDILIYIKNSLLIKKKVKTL